MKLIARRDIHYGIGKVAKAGMITPEFDAETAASLIAGGYADEYVEPKKAGKPDKGEGDGKAGGDL